MVAVGEVICPRCGGALKHYDEVDRTLRSKRAEAYRIRIRRVRCGKCGAVHREMPRDVMPHKQYEAEVVLGVIEGLITPDVLGFEDYPCEATMNRWRKEHFPPELFLR